MNKFLLLFGLILISTYSRAQHTFPENNDAFLQNEVATVRITINPDSLAALLDLSIYSEEKEYSAQFKYESSNFNQTIPAVGFRLRGNTSLYSQKKSFKISFNTFTPNGEWQGLEKMNLNGSHNDPSMIRAKLSWESIKNNGLPGSRSSFISLYINDEYRGLYSNIEHIDEVFASSYFDGTGDGNLYKCTYPSNLKFINNNPDSYKFISGSRRAYELNTNNWLDDYSDLANFIKVLNQTEISELPCALEQIFNVDNYLKVAALDVLMGNWDNYIFNKNNFYLYHNQLTGQFEYIPYDLDNTWGIDWVNQNWISRDIYNWSQENESRPLYTRLLEVPEFRSRFSFYIKQFATSTMHEDTVANSVNQMLTLISPAAALDSYRTFDYGFTFEDFQNSGTIPWGNQVEEAIIPFITARNASTLAQVEEAATPFGKIVGWIEGVLDSNPIMRAYCKNCMADSIGWEYSTDGINWSLGSSLQDNGVSPDTLANDNVFSAIVNNATTGNEFKFRFFSITNGNNYYWPCSPLAAYLGVYPDGLVINEVMSSNQSTIADELGGFADWIELYNGNSSAQSLNGYFLTDNPNKPYKFPLPAETIGLAGFKLFWADSDEETGRNHCNFNVSAAGEPLWIVKAVANGYKVTNYKNLPSMSPDVSYGRILDGNDNWTFFSPSTPNGTNNPIGIAEINSKSWKPFPNPTNSTLSFNQNVSIIKVTDLTGKVVALKYNCNLIDLSHLSASVYFLNADGQVFKVIKN